MHKTGTEHTTRKDQHQLFSTLDDSQLEPTMRCFQTNSIRSQARIHIRSLCQFLKPLHEFVAL